MTDRPRYRKPDAVKTLEMAAHIKECSKHPTLKPCYIPRPRYRDDTANGLTQCIIKLVELLGGQAERINGTADISATIKGRRVKIDVKVGTDRQRHEQIDRDGGLYVIAKDLDSFVGWYASQFGGCLEQLQPYLLAENI